MGLNDILLNGALATLLSLGTPSTPSSHLRPASDLYNPGAGSADHADGPREQRQPATAQPINRLRGSRTGDTGAKLDPRRFVGPRGTGVLLLHPSPEHPQIDSTHIMANTHGIELAMPSHARTVQWIKNATGLPEERVACLLGVSRIAIRDWEAGRPIRETNRRRLLETKDILQRAERQHPGRDSLVAWLDTPDPVQETSPATLLERGNLDLARLLAVLAPTSVAPMPTWARRSTSPAWRQALEQPERQGEFLHD
jgi:DNA-binding transcriptional regulator YiaG